jgi:hypothetical protein
MAKRSGPFKRKRVVQFKFPPMLGPADPHPIDSAEFALCLGNELDYRSDQMIDFGAERMLPLVQRAIETQAWLRWDPPDPEAYFHACTGLSYRQIYSVIDTLLADHGIAR